jgi:hypothetical protein
VGRVFGKKSENNWMLGAGAKGLACFYLCMVWEKSDSESPEFC